MSKTIEAAYTLLTTVLKSNEEIAQEKISLEERLFNATATQQQIIDKARNSVSDYNKTLYDQVIAAEKTKAAAEKTQSLNDAIMSLEKPLEYQQLLRERELATLTEGDKVLQKRIWALQEEAVAAEKTQSLNDAIMSLEI